MAEGHRMVDGEDYEMIFIGLPGCGAMLIGRGIVAQKPRP